jgi:two-component system sensor histidine kinase GlrK
VRFRYPDSFTRLLLISFVVVALPLLLALAQSLRTVERAVERSEKAVYEAARSGRNGRLLTEQVRQMERTLRRYLVLGEADLLAQFDQLHVRFRQTADEMGGQQLGEVQLKQLRLLAEREAEMYRSLRADPRPARARELAGKIAELSDLSQAVLDEANQAIDREVELMRESARGERARAFWLGLPALPLAGLAALAFTWLIARPVRQIDGAIRKLGDADFETPIAVRGPRDLEYLGERLDWLRQRLAEVEQQKDAFLRGVSHELKTPLTALREGAELLGEGAAGSLSEEQQALVGILRNKSLQLQGLIDDLLNYQKARSRGVELANAEVDFTRLVRSTLEDHAVPLRARGLTVDTVALQGVSVHADANKLRTIVDNLLTNAVKFSPQGGVITLRAQAEAQSLVFEVQDQGPGVAPGDEKRIFELFYQGKHRPQGPVPGSGLGLAIARELALLHGGRLELVLGGQGACFRLSLPWRAGTSTAREAAHA